MHRIISRSTWGQVASCMQDRPTSGCTAASSSSSPTLRPRVPLRMQYVDGKVITGCFWQLAPVSATEEFRSYSVIIADQSLERPQVYQLDIKSLGTLELRPVHRHQHLLCASLTRPHSSVHVAFPFIRCLGTNEVEPSGRCPQDVLEGGEAARSHHRTRTALQTVVSTDNPSSTPCERDLT